MVRNLGWGAAALYLLISASNAWALDTGQCLPMSDMNTALKTEGQRSLVIGDRMDYEGQLVAFGDTTMTRAKWRDITRDLESDTPYRRDLTAKLRANGRTPAQIDAFVTKLRKVSAILEKGDPDSPVPRFMVAIVSNADGSLGYILEGDKPSMEASTRACIRGRLADLTVARRADLNGGGTADIVSAHGDVIQTNGTKVSDVSIALRGGMGTGEGMLVALLPGNKAPPLFAVQNLKLRPAALERARD